VAADHYAASGTRWALGAELVYRPIAAALVATSPHRLSGHVVLDAGAGTGAASAALRRCGAQVVATDLSPAMLAWQQAERPPCAAAEHAFRRCRRARSMTRWPRSCSTTWATGHGLAELLGSPRPGGAILAAVFANDSRSEACDRVDAGRLLPQAGRRPRGTAR
jgi:SAM-dependent methyltransferase